MTLLGQSHITSINYVSPLPTSVPSTVSVTAPSDAINDIQPGQPYDVYYGTGDNLKIESYTVGGRLYNNFVLPDTLIIRRTDNQAYINVWYTLSSFVDPIFPSPGELYLDADEVGDADALYQSGILNAGYDNIMVNDDDEGGNTIQAQVERLDVIWYSGLVTCEPDSAVFPIIERGGNDEIKVAAILSLDINGNPASYGTMIDIENSDWPDPTNAGIGGGRSFDNFLILRRQDTGVDPTPIANIGTLNSVVTQYAQSLQGVAISFDELGIGQNQVVYGFSIFAFDTNATDHDLTDIYTFPTNTKASDSGLDLVAGLSAGVSADNCLTPATGPGGYKAALTTWLKANVGVTTATDGSTVTDWQDQWIGDHDATTGVAAPTYRSTTSNINFNPTVDFTTGSTSLTIANNLAFNTGGPYTRKGINLAFRTSTSDINTRQVLYEQGGSTRGITVYLRDGNLYLSSWNRTSEGSGSPWNTTTNVATISTALTTNTEYIVTLEFSGNTSSTGTVKGYLNGQNFGTLNNVGLLYSDTDGIEFGASDGDSRYDNGSSSSPNSYYGEISELIYCNEPGSFLLTQRNKIESYLAIKYGITLDQSTPINYVNSQGNVTFNTTNSAAIGGYLEYNKDIAGIARDDNSEFEQIKSRSENIGSVVTMDHGGSFSSNNSWLIWGNDSGDKDDDEITDVPPLITRRVERVWRVGETGETGNNSISFDISGFTFNGGIPSESDFSLLIADNSSGGVFTSSQIITGGTLSGNTITFSGVNFENGEYFTLGTGFISCGPGNVTTNLTLWLRADNGPNTSINGADVSSWGDFSGSNDATGASNLPNYASNSINFNPAINFDESNSEHLSGGAGFNSTAYYLVFNPDVQKFHSTTADVIVGFNAPTATANLGGFGIGNMSGSTANELFTHLMGTSSTWRSMVKSASYGATSVNPGINFLMGIRDNAGATGTDIYINGAKRNDFAQGSFLTSSNVYYSLGNFATNALGANAFYDGQIAELISFSVRPDDTDEHLRIQSYLAIKYGITLNQTSGQNYLNSSGSVIWNATDNSSYKNDIAGIGRDDGSCFAQKQSKSVNDEAIVTIGLGAIAVDNKSNPNSFSVDESFMVWGNDNASKLQSNAVNDINDVTPDVPSGVTERMRRVWRVDETGTVGNTTISFDLTGLGYSSTAADFKLILSSSSTMASGTTLGGGTFNGNVLTFENVDFTDGDYFTLGTAIEPCGPGGVTSGLALWLKANNGPDAITNDAIVNTWADKSTANNNGLEHTGAGFPVKPRLKTSTFNFNPSVRFSDPGSTELSYIRTDNGNVVSDDMTLATVFSTTQNGGDTTNFENSPILMSSGKLANSADYGLGFANGLVHFNASNSSGRDAYSTNIYNNGRPHIAMGTRVKAVSGAVELYVDAANVGSGTSDNVSLSGGTAMGIGNNDDNTINSQLQGDIAEAIAFSRVLTANERIRVDSYLALKYGITRAGGTGERNYLASDGGVTWDWTEQPTYNYNISGLARDDNSCFLQETSKSSNAGTIVKMASVNPLAVDDSFSVWGSENKPLTGTSADGNVEFNTAQVKSRLFREWYVQETGTVGLVDLTFDLFAIGGPSGVGTNNLNLVRLMLDADGDFTSGVTLQAPTSIDAVNKTVTFRVNLADTQFFTLGATEKYALPITLISFDVKNINSESVQLKWTTANEVGNAYYTIERSSNGKDFTAIGVLDGAGNSDESLNYIYNDSEPLSGTSYYRLKQTDFNGEFEYSEVKRVSLTRNQFEINNEFSVFPNPVVFGEKFKLAYKVAKDQNIELQIVTTSGVVVGHSSYEIKASSTYLELESRGLPKGLNLMRIIDGERKITTIKILVR